MVGTIYKRTRTRMGTEGRNAKGGIRLRRHSPDASERPGRIEPTGRIMIVEGDEVRSRLLSSTGGGRAHWGCSEDYTLPDNYNEAYHLARGRRLSWCSGDFGQYRRKHSGNPFFAQLPKATGIESAALNLCLRISRKATATRFLCGAGYLRGKGPLIRCALRP